MCKRPSKLIAWLLDRDEAEAARKMRLHWWGVLSVILGSLPLFFLFDRIGKLPLALPTFDSAAVIIIAIAIKRKLRRYVWFWITVTIIVAFHVLLILVVPWPTGWTPAPVIIPIAYADIAVVLAIIRLVENQFLKTAPMEMRVSAS
jgi:hypothetical protein